EIDRLQSAKNFSQVDELGMLVLKYHKHIQGYPSHLSVHSSGVIISDEPITAYTATMMPPKGFPTIHFSMLESEDIGLHKFDILGQRGLGKIKDSLQIIKDNTGDEFDIHDINRFKQDPDIKKYLKAGDAIGCFYVESPAMRMLLTKLRAEDYLRLVAASSIIRPGVAQSGMMNEYIQRFHDEERRNKAREALPELYDILHETYGVMVYQEDVIKVAHYFADLPLSEADVLRRGMSWKFRERNQFDLVKSNFFENCKKKGHKEETIQGIWTQIESFANYAFSKGHSASYAVESYQALFLKVHYPLEYMVATLNNGGGFYRRDVYLHEAKKYGATIELPCVNKSNALCAIYGKSIYIGLGFLAGVEMSTVTNMVNERTENGPFKDLRDFLRRIPVSLEQLRPLIRIGAFRFTGKGKKELLWDAHFMLSETKKKAPTPNLFEVDVREFTIPELWNHELEEAFDEMELIGFPVNTSPFALVKEIPDLPIRAKDLPVNVGQQVSMLVYLINIKYTQTGKGISMNFGTWYDTDGAWVDTVHFPDSAVSFPFQGPGCYVIKGKVMNEFGFVSIDVTHMERLATRNMDVVTVRLKPGVQPLPEERQLE
ncbi:MAG TPA: DNA polymerase III subunit alpha, partial [Bacteroidia bacterium]|nr:DNA polymerase III subunit alpha [Bacteroidia bacterium]